LGELLKEPRFLIEGNYARTLEMRLAACDTVLLLDYPVEVCLAGVESRIGKKREDMPWVETEFDPEFREYILHFAAERLPYIYQCLNNARGKRVVIFHSREEAADFLETL
jgi:adenylate kinase family enzyme